MSEYLCISVRFADPSFHGRADAGASEWPPSPLRLYQALVAAAAARFGNPDRFRDYAVPAFEWLAALPPPAIVAPAAVTGTPFRTAVPNNDLDVLARDWARGVEPDRQPAALKTLKTVRPTHVVGGGEFPAVHYLWEVAEADRPGCERNREFLFAAARDLVALGWGTDMAFGHGRLLSAVEVRRLVGERWEPTSEAATRLRVPTPGTFDALVARYAAFRTRLGENGFVPVPPLTAFAVVGYRRPTEPAERPFVAFELRTPDFERFRPFDPTRYTAAVAGMVRNALAKLARDMQPFGWTTEQINTFVHGHTPDGEHPNRGPDADTRFTYLPLPSVEQRGPREVVVTAIRRVLVVGPPGGERQVAWARVLSGQHLFRVGQSDPAAALRLIDQPAAALRGDRNLRWYVGESAEWSTVTPVIRPGHDNGNPAKAERLLRTAFVQAGWPEELIEPDGLDWRSVGYRAGVEPAVRYQPPDRQDRLPRCHVRVRFRVPVRGPLAVGAGRYRGFGVFAADTPD